MTVNLTWQMIGVVMVMLSHVIVTVIWATRLTDNMEVLHTCLDRMEKDWKRRDDKVDAAFEKIDSHEVRITVLETKTAT